MTSTPGWLGPAAVVYDHSRWRCRVLGCPAEPKGWQVAEKPARAAHEHFVENHQPRGKERS